MARSRQPQGYPKAYFDLIETVANTGKEFVLPRKDRKAAELMRFQLYAFIKACRASSNERDKLIGKQAYGLVFSVKGGNLVISLRDNTDEAQALEAALSEYTSESAPAQQKSAIIPPAQSPVNTPHSPSHDEMIDKYLKERSK